MSRPRNVALEYERPTGEEVVIGFVVTSPRSREMVVYVDGEVVRREVTTDKAMDWARNYQSFDLATYAGFSKEAL